MAKSYNDVQQVFTIIGKGTVLTGEVKAEGDTRIDGELQGKIECSGKIIIGLTGKVIGELKCANLEVLGSVEGKVEASQKSILREKSTIKGEIKTKVLTIEPGAIFCGQCDMSSDEKADIKEDKNKKQ